MSVDGISNVPSLCVRVSLEHLQCLMTGNPFHGHKVDARLYQMRDRAVPQRVPNDLA
ncbi:hypothetical protein LXM88_35080 [Burkholderia sp. S-53]|nr:hypothetical protein [Burkholderia sp. S-53]UXU90513.1 hypothetical protein LXM88_35080 [Burkholderia sp. S-53]